MARLLFFLIPWDSPIRFLDLFTVIWFSYFPRLEVWFSLFFLHTFGESFFKGQGQVFPPFGPGFGNSGFGLTWVPNFFYLFPLFSFLGLVDFSFTTI